ncbi:hypothetical protein [Dolichospermum phage Dfl-JY23]
MFGDKHSHDSNGSNSTAIIKSGYDVTALAGNANMLKNTFHQALHISDIKKCDEKQIRQASKDAGALKGLLTNFKHFSRQKLEVARNALALRNAALNHQRQAAGLELQYQQGTDRHLQAMSDTLLQLGIVEETHTGFTQYCDTADRLLKGL